jgi:hypothetical protein
MVIYVAFVAITNIIVGYTVSRVLSRSSAAEAEAVYHRESDDGVTDSAGTETDLSAPPGNATIGTPTAADATEPSVVEPVPAVKRAKTVVAFKSWDDFAVQLRDIRDRARYCKSAQDIRMTQQAVDQLRACVECWYAQFAPCLAGDQLDDATQALVSGADQAAVEMFAAQCETSISNIGAIDLSAGTDAVLADLEREIALLDQARKAVTKN